MSLKAKLSKAEHAALPDALREHYTEKDGVFILQADGVVGQDEYDALETKLSEFRDNNRKLHADLRKFDGVDPEEFKTLKASAGKKPETTDIAVQIAQAVEKATEPLTAKLKGIEEERDKARLQLSDKALEDALWAAGQKAGVLPSAKDEFLFHAKKVFVLEGDQPVAKKGDAVVFSRRRGHVTDPLTPEEWASDPEWLMKEKSFLFEKSAGANTPRNQTNGSGQRIVANDPESVSRNLEDIASGKVLVQ